MGKHFSYLIFAAMILPLLGGCADDVLEFSSSKIEMQKLVAQSEMKPLDVSSEVLAKYLAPAKVVTMWQGPMRIAIEDENGDDLDLSSYPGNVIKYYFTVLPSYVSVPVSITSAKNHDNNVSIVIPFDTHTRENVGALWGVPELASQSSKYMSGLLEWKPRASISRSIAESDAYPDSTFNTYELSDTIRGCVIGISIKHSSEADIHPLWEVIDQFTMGCMGPWLDIRHLPKERQILTEDALKISRAFNNNAFYLRRVWYGSGLRPSMSAKTAHRKILEYLNAKQNN